MATVALTIAGSDPSGGAGIQADLKTFHAFGVFGTAAIAALTVQNTLGVRAVRPVDADLVAAQVDAVLDDLDVRAVKTGLLPSAAIVEAVAARRLPALVVDPVAVATTGEVLAEPAVLAVLRRELLPHACLVTPNLLEAGALLGTPVSDLPAMRVAARRLVELGAQAALVTGGHLPGPPCDVLFVDGTVHELTGTRIPVTRAHGTGCTLSAAIAAGLAQGRTILDAVHRAKAYVTRALATASPIGHGSQPLNHLVRPDDA